MPDDIKGAKDGVSPTPGANGTEPPTVEELQKQLKEAQDSAETGRKSMESLKADLESAREELSELNEKVKLTAAERDRKSDLQDQIQGDRKSLAKRMRAQAEAGDKDAAAWIATAEAIAEEKFAEFQQKSVQEMTKRELERDFKTRDDMLTAKAREKGVSVEEFKKLVNPYAKHYPKTTYTPSDQLKLAIELMEKEEGIIKSKKELEDEKAKNANFRDGGTGHDNKNQDGTKKKDWSAPGAWRDAKTPQEKEQALYTI